MAVLKMRKDIKKNDTVKVLSGDFKSKVGKVLHVVPKLNKILVEGVNKVQKHQKPGGQNPGGIIEKHMLIDASNVSLVDPKSKEAIKVGFKHNEKGVKQRFNKKTGSFLD